MVKKALIREAQRRLKEKPFDVAHDLTHHKAVWFNCRKIIQKEKLGVDIDVIELAAWWHDVEKDCKDETLFFKKTCKKLKVSKEFCRKVVDVIKNHSYGKNQETEDAKVLFDADKIEYASILRVKKLLQEFKRGGMKQERFDYYVGSWRERIKKVKDSFHFKYSKKIFDKKLVEFMNYCKKQESLGKFISGIVL